MIDSICQPDRRQTFRAGLLPNPASDHSRDHDVFQRGELREKELALENETHLLVAKPGEGRLAAAVERASFEFDLA